MFGIGPMEAIIIALVAIIFVGPEKLPGVLKKFGRFYVQAKRHANDVKSGFDSAIHEAERDLELDRIRELQKQIQEATNLSSIIDADHTDKSSAHTSGDASDPLHTADGRLIDPPTDSSSTSSSASASSAMPPDEIDEQQRTAYHEGHLPPRSRDEDHDPFAQDSLKNRDLAEEDTQPAADAPKKV